MSIGEIEKYKIPILFVFLNALIYVIIAAVRVSFGKYGTIEALIFRNILPSIAFIIPLLLVYFWGYRNIKRFPTGFIILGYLIFASILIATPVLTSMDMYMYPMRARIASVYGQNPYLKSAADFPTDPFYKNICGSWANLTEGYGVMWTIFSVFITRIAADSIDITYLLYKVFAFVGNSIVLLLLYLIARLKSFDKLKTKKLLFLYAWSPVFLIEFVNNAHNDVWMLVFGLLALYFYYKKRDILVLPALVLAGLTKYIYWILIPIFLFFLIKQRRLTFKKLFYSSLISLVILLITISPFFNNIQMISHLLQKFGSVDTTNPGIFLIAILCLGNTFGFYSIVSFTYIIILIGNLFFFFGYWINLFLRKDIVKAVATSLVLLVIFIPSSTRPWYVTWFLPFYILDFRILHIVFWTCSAIIAYPFSYSLSVSTIVFFVVFCGFFVIHKLIKTYFPLNK